jgi:hypothetical protein
MAAFRRFDPYALRAENRKQSGALACLAALAGAGADTEDRADTPAEENHDRRGTAAKVAKPAKVFEPVPPSRGEVEEECGAIIQRDGNAPRAWAEGFARLHPDRPLGDVPSKRWVSFLGDAGYFLDSPFYAIAAALDWGPHDLFGVTVTGRLRGSIRPASCGY